MSETNQRRIAVLQHRRRQIAAQEALSRVSDEVGEIHHQLVDPGISLLLQTDLYAKLKEKRVHAQLRKRTFTDAAGAVAVAAEQLNRLGSKAVFEVYVGANGSGFFSGPISAALLSVCLGRGYEGFAAVLPSLESGVFLDVVSDDPLQGNFYEVEWW